MGKNNDSDDREKLSGWTLRLARAKVHPAPGVRAEWAAKGENSVRDAQGKPQPNPDCRHRYQVRGRDVGKDRDMSWYCSECGKPM